MKELKSRAKNIFKIILQVFLICIFTLILLEISLGVYFKIKDRNLIDAETYDYPFLYFKPLEDSGYRNEDGLKIFRSREKPDKTYRIIIAGGSVVYGSEPDNTISSNLEKLLQKKFPGKKIEVLNAGVPAYVIEQEFILIQLALQYYEPDMIISLDGYNDLITTEINRFYPCPDILPPHNWRDFRSIKHQTSSRKILGRFYGLFPNIERLTDFFTRKFYNDKNGYNDMKNNKHNIAQTYSRRVKDIKAFCIGKEIEYFHILQPLRFVDAPNNEREETLVSIYKCMNDSLISLEYYSDFSNALIESKNVFKDECHFDAVGNKIIASLIADYIYPTLSSELYKNTEILPK